jgi:hypothetical protein
LTAYCADDVAGVPSNAEETSPNEISNLRIGISFLPWVEPVLSPLTRSVCVIGISPSGAADGAARGGASGNSSPKQPSAHAPSRTQARTFHALAREPLVRRLATATSGPTCCRCSRRRAGARRLRTSTPAAEPAILLIRGCGIFEALTSVLRRRSLEVISLCGSHKGSKCGQGC